MTMMILSKARIGRCAILAMTVLGLSHGIAVAAGATGTYAEDLGSVYGGYQRSLALKEACDTAVPELRGVNEKAFAAWQARHRVLVEELQRHVTAMIRRASQDEKEYARNLGKYEGAILAERQQYRETLLGLGGAELREQCRRLPETLKGPGADLEKVYASELEVIRKRK